MEAELIFKIVALPQVKSPELAVFPLHFPVMSTSQHVLVVDPRIDAALGLR
jgi:hypothetical protein